MGTYQAMLYDQLDIKGDRYSHEITTDGKKEVKEVLLNENDILWPTYRHMFISDCIETVTKNFDEFTKTNKAAGFQKKEKGEKDLKDTSDAIRAMPQFREFVSKYSLHIGLTSQLMQSFTTKKLDEVSRLEQNMAMGADNNGDPLKQVLQTVNGLLQDGGIGAMEKLRLLIVYLVTQEGIRDSDRDKLMEMARLSPTDRAAINNMRFLGFQLGKG